MFTVIAFTDRSWRSVQASWVTISRVLRPIGPGS